VRTHQNTPPLPRIIKPMAAVTCPVSAAQWVATRGGEEAFDPEDKEVWRRAFADLIDQVSTGDVLIPGVRIGLGEMIDGSIFVGCRVNCPYEDTRSFSSSEK
jgi:hypothetical protein